VPARAGNAGAIAAIAGLTVAGGILWFWRIGSKSLFLDEGFTASTVLRSWRSLLELTVVHETSGALHAVLLRPLTEFGQSEAVLRSLSAMCLIALVPVVGALGWRLVSPPACSSSSTARSPTSRSTTARTPSPCCSPVWRR
jgi:hypothetical protein